MQVALTFTFSPGEGALYEAALAKMAALSALLTEEAAETPVPQAVSSTKSSPATKALTSQRDNALADGDYMTALKAESDRIKIESDAEIADPFALGETPAPQTTAPPVADEKPKRGRRVSSKITTEHVLAGGEPQKRPAPKAKEPVTLKEVSVDQLQTMAREVITKQPNDRQKVMDCVFAFTTEKGTKAMTWKDLDAAQRIDAMKTLQIMYLGDSIPF